MSKKQKKARMFSALEVANLCGVVNQTAINWIRNGYIKAFTTPGGQFRVYPEDLADFLQKKGMKIPQEIFSAMGSETTIESVLVLSTNPILQDEFSQVLLSWSPNVSVHRAMTIFNAGRMAEASKANLVLIDMDFGGEKALDIIETFRSEPNLGLPWVLAIGSSNDPAIRQAAISAGAHDFITLPLTLEAFRAYNQNLPKVVKKKDFDKETTQSEGNGKHSYSTVF